MEKNILYQLRSNESYQFQKIVTFVGIVLFLVKFIAWYITDSVAILTDALESTINVISGFIGLYSLYLSSLPRDRNHPYGHGKIEFISASIEGILISVAGVIIIYEAIDNLQNPSPVSKLDYGIYLIALTAIINYVVGYYAVSKGKKNRSVALIASGKHLQSDTYSTIGVIAGLIILHITKIQWLDSAIALIFAGIIIFTGYKIIKGAISGIMDETDEELLEEVVHSLNTNRRTHWIDIHNLRIIKYGSTLHFDCHLTVPWYFNIEEGHKEVEILEDIIKQKYGESVEFFVHLDACKPYSCKICAKQDCKVRLSAFEKNIVWTKENVVKNQKHASTL